MPPVPPGKAEGAFRTIGELSRDTGLPTHVLRYWETRFPQLRPLTRAGRRRYYRAEDVALVRRIDTLLNRDGYTVRGVQQLLAGKATIESAPTPDIQPAGQPDPTPPISVQPAQLPDSVTDTLRAIRDLLAAALRDDDRSLAQRFPTSLR